MLSYFQLMTLSVQRTCQRLEPYERMTSWRWRVVLRTAANGRQSWDGSTLLHVVTLPPKTPQHQSPIQRPLVHSWQLWHLLVYKALRLFAALTLLRSHHLYRPQLRTYRITRTRGRHQHLMYTVSLITLSYISVAGEDWKQGIKTVFFHTRFLLRNSPKKHWGMTRVVKGSHFTSTPTRLSRTEQTTLA